MCVRCIILRSSSSNDPAVAIVLIVNEIRKHNGMLAMLHKSQHIRDAHWSQSILARVRSHNIFGCKCESIPCVWTLPQQLLRVQCNRLAPKCALRSPCVLIGCARNEMDAHKIVVEFPFRWKFVVWPWSTAETLGCGSRSGGGTGARRG